MIIFIARLSLIMDSFNTDMVIEYSSYSFIACFQEWLLNNLCWEK